MNEDYIQTRIKDFKKKEIAAVLSALGAVLIILSAFCEWVVFRIDADVDYDEMVNSSFFSSLDLESLGISEEIATEETAEVAGSGGLNSITLAMNIPQIFRSLHTKGSFFLDDNVREAEILDESKYLTETLYRYLFGEAFETEKLTSFYDGIIMAFAAYNYFAVAMILFPLAGAVLLIGNHVNLKPAICLGLNILVAIMGCLIVNETKKYMSSYGIGPVVLLLGITLGMAGTAVKQSMQKDICRKSGGK